MSIETASADARRTPAEPRPAGTILLLRDVPEYQVLMVRRHHQIDFASGALVFPGGKMHPGDDDPRWRDHVTGWDEIDATQRALRIGAIREAFEEAGILLANYPDGRGFSSVCDAEARRKVDTGELAFLDVVAGLGVKLSLTALTVFARWITPEMMPKRFDTWFYAAPAPADQVAICDGHETVDAEWIAPESVLDLARSGARTVIFPTLMNVKLLAEAESAADCLARAEARPLVTVLPQVETRDGERVLTIPLDAGYGEVTQSLAELRA
ncbi:MULTISPECIES: NUDIX hydrolase [Alphaproteobacteria]|uniref:NUDIX hydrolase n=1 Tax=unclassified Sphingomonas TaxID=196159 RepID=UPI00262A37EE|nr:MULTISPECIES: NUDIX domain-containing protein [Alphaproteobacteria]